MTPRLGTRRVWLEPLRLEDAEQVQPLFAQWEVVRYLRDVVLWPFPPDGVHVYYRDTALPGVERGEEWHWTLRRKQSPEGIIGAIGLFRSEENNRGFWMGAPWHGHGLMTEAVEAATEFWFEELGFAELRAPKASVNTASVRISEKTGMHLESRHRQGFVEGELDAETWVITFEEWLVHKREAALRGAPLVVPMSKD